MDKSLTKGNVQQLYVLARPQLSVLFAGLQQEGAKPPCIPKPLKEEAGSRFRRENVLKLP